VCVCVCVCVYMFMCVYVEIYGMADKRHMCCMLVWEYVKNTLFSMGFIWVLYGFYMGFMGFIWVWVLDTYLISVCNLRK
jgi:hypothetical protein